MDLFIKKIEFQPCQSFGNIPTKPFRRATAVVYSNCLYVFAGVQHNDDLHEYNFNDKTWRKIPKSAHAPSARFGHTSVVYKDEMYVCFGYDFREETSETFKFNFTTKRWHKLACDVFGRCYHTCNLYKDFLIVFGGSWDYRYLNDVRQYDIANNNWSKFETHGDIPSKRFDHSSIINNGKLYIFGGKRSDAAGNQMDVYSLNLTNHKWSIVETSGDIPSQRFGHLGLLLDDDWMLIHGGNDILADFYLFDLRIHTFYKIPYEGKIEKLFLSGVIYKNNIYILGNSNSSISIHEDFLKLVINEDHFDWKRMRTLLQKRKFTDLEVIFNL